VFLVILALVNMIASINERFAEISGLSLLAGVGGLTNALLFFAIGFALECLDQIAKESIRKNEHGN
jgi:hypothetical protein